MYRRGPSTVCLQNGGNAGVVRPEDTVGLVEHAGSFWTGRVEVYMVQQSSKNMGGCGDNLLEASLLQAGGEEVVRTLDVVQVTVGQKNCGLAWVQMKEHFSSELLDLGTAGKPVDVDDVIANVGGFQERTILRLEAGSVHRGGPGH